jgi:FlaA1/EpsC-like NDP-sugar epimerase
LRAERIKQSIIDASVVRVPARAPRWIVPAVKVTLVITDAFAAALSFMLAFYTRERISIFATSESFAWSARFAPYGALLIFVVAIRLLSFRYCNLYRVRGEFSFVDDSIRVFKATAIGSLLIVAAAFLYRGGFEFRAFSYARSVFVADFIFVLVGIGALRFLMRAVQMFVRSRQINLIPTLVVGRGPKRRCSYARCANGPRSVIA